MLFVCVSAIAVCAKPLGLGHCDLLCASTTLACGGAVVVNAVCKAAMHVTSTAHPVAAQRTPQGTAYSTAITLETWLLAVCDHLVTDRCLPGA